MKILEVAPISCSHTETFALYTHTHAYLQKKLYMPVARVFKWTFTSLTSPWHFINIQCFSFIHSLCKFTMNIETLLLSIRTMLQFDNYISCNFSEYFISCFLPLSSTVPIPAHTVQGFLKLNFCEFP